MNSPKTRRILIAVLSAICLVLMGVFWYLFDTNVDRSGWVEKEGIYSYRDFHGRKVTGWQNIADRRYFFHEDKTMATQWLETEEGLYHLGQDGALDYGWIDTQEGRYYADARGIIQTGWLDVDFQRYWLGTDGIMQTGWLEQAGNTYYLNPDGAMALGFTPIGEDNYYFSETGQMHTGELTLGEERYLFEEDGVQHTGWLEQDGASLYYRPADGSLATGWEEIGESLYYFDDDGIMHTGWLQLGEYRYYLHPDGTAAVGPTQIDGATYYFTPKGIHVVLVNEEHKVPDYYEMELVTVQDWHRVSSVCLEPLQQMLSDCTAAGIEYTFNSGYRSLDEQKTILEYRAKEYEEQGYDPTRAYMKARETVALPGTSEHHLGLAVDLLGEEAIAWFGEHCWDYGFILRYTEEKEPITGFVDEPWHFRYVGTEVSLDMKGSGLCLEEYLGAWTPDEAQEDSEPTS